MANYTFPGSKHQYRGFWFHIKTLYLFTKSDFKTVILPQSFFAIALAHHSGGLVGGPAQVSCRIALALTWLWTHLLVENIANQRLPESALEDAVNKPWRPLPSERLTGAEATLLLRFVLPAAYMLSLVVGATAPSTTLMTLMWLYNDLEGASCGPWTRNLLNAVGLACFGWGTVEVLLDAATDDPITATVPGRLPYEWIGLTALLVATTIQAQDLPDIPGDKARGRSTMPLLYGELSTRVSVAVSVVSWSVACLVYWEIKSSVVWLMPLSTAFSMAMLTLLRQSRDLDEIVWKLWCVWVTMVYSLPFFGSGAAL